MEIRAASGDSGRMNLGGASGPGSTLRGVRTLALALCAGLGLAAAPAAAQSSLSACVGRVVNAARSQGAKASAQKPVDFLLTGDEKSYEYMLPEAGCLGFLAVGQRHVLHLGLSVFSPGGGQLAQDAGRDAHAYARVCAGRGQRVVVNVRMLDGEGEFQLVPLWNAPERLASLEPIMSTCMNTGSARPALIDVGPEPQGASIAHGMDSLVHELRALGYAPLPDKPLAGSLSEKRRDLRQVFLQSGRCYALAAVGDSEVEDLDLRLLAPHGAAGALASDITRSREAVVKICPEHTAEYELDVRMYRGAGDYVLQTFELAESAADLPVGIEGRSKIAYLELTAQLRARGLRAAPVAWSVVDPERPRSVPVSLRGAGCYAIAAVASDDVANGDLDMSLVDAAGRMLSAELGPSPHPLLYHCAQHDALGVRAVVQSHQLRKPARFLLVMGEPLR